PRAGRGERRPAKGGAGAGRRRGTRPDGRAEASRVLRAPDEGGRGLPHGRRGRRRVPPALQEPARAPLQIAGAPGPPVVRPARADPERLTAPRGDAGMREFPAPRGPARTISCPPSP